MRVPFIGAYENNSVGSWSLCSLFLSGARLKPRLSRAPQYRCMCCWLLVNLEADVLMEIYAFPLPSSLGVGVILYRGTGRIDYFLSSFLSSCST